MPRLVSGSLLGTLDIAIHSEGSCPYWSKYSRVLEGVPVGRTRKGVRWTAGIHTYTCACTHAYIRTDAHSLTCLLTYLLTYLVTYLPCLLRQRHTYILHMYTYVYICMYIYTVICVYLSITESAAAKPQACKYII